MTNEVKLFNNEMFGEVRVVMKEDQMIFAGYQFISWLF